MKLTRRLLSSASPNRRVEHKDHVWCWDFIYDSDERGRSLKGLSIVDEFTRECLVLEMDRSIRSGDVLDLLTELFMIRGVPKLIRSDNGPEFIADRIKKHLQRANVHAGYIERGSPWENGYAESFHSRLRDELLNAGEFDGVRDAKMHAARWKNDYNHRRPHSSLGYVPPAVFAAMCVEGTPLRLAALASAARPHAAIVSIRCWLCLPAVLILTYISAGIPLRRTSSVQRKTTPLTKGGRS